jgi:hypothetical protein
MEWVVGFFHFLEHCWASIEKGVVVASLLALFKFNTSKCSLKTCLFVVIVPFFYCTWQGLDDDEYYFLHNPLVWHYDKKHNAFVEILKNHPWQKNHWVCKRPSIYNFVPKNLNFLIHLKLEEELQLLYICFNFQNLLLANLPFSI